MQIQSAELLKYAYELGAAQALADMEKEAYAGAIGNAGRRLAGGVKRVSGAVNDATTRLAIKAQAVPGVGAAVQSFAGADPSRTLTSNVTKAILAGGKDIINPRLSPKGQSILGSAAMLGVPTAAIGAGLYAKHAYQLGVEQAVADIEKEASPLKNIIGKGQYLAARVTPTLEAGMSHIGTPGGSFAGNLIQGAGGAVLHHMPKGWSPLKKGLVGTGVTGGAAVGSQYV